MTTLWHLSETTSSSVSHLEVIFSLEILLLATMHKRPFCRSSGEAALPLGLRGLRQHGGVHGLSRAADGRVVDRAAGTNKWNQLEPFGANWNQVGLEPRLTTDIAALLSDALFGGGGGSGGSARTTEFRGDRAICKQPTFVEPL